MYLYVYYKYVRTKHYKLISNALNSKFTRGVLGKLKIRNP